MRLIDLTHEFGNDMPVYPGDPSSALTRIAEIPKDGFTDHELRTAMHVGTHMDAPLHMIEGGKALGDMPMGKFMGRGRLLDARGYDAVPASLLDGVSVAPCDILLILTGHAAKFRKPGYFDNAPLVSEEFARRATGMGVSAVGMDTPGPDLPPFPVHKILLARDVLIIENLTNLEVLLGIGNFNVIALPLKLRTDAAPARVVALVG